MRDLIIAGAGPAGLTAAIYAARGGIDVLVLERSFAGGQMAISSTIENYPGYENDTPGAAIANSMKLQAQRMGAEILTEDIKSFDIAGGVKKVVTSKGSHEAKAVVLAMGAVPRQIGVEGEARLAGAGVSYCATCDGAFFRDGVTVVVGGGNTAVEDALYLSNICKEVHLLHRRMQFRAQHALVEKVKKLDNVFLHLPYVPVEVTGEYAVDGIKIKNVETGGEEHIGVNGVFFAVGNIPKTELVTGQVDTDEAGYIVSGESCETNLPGVFCAGDIRTKRLRQIVTATADGAMAASAAEEYLFRL
jgi:thioredoxin reductase (NADPH)